MTTEAGKQLVIRAMDLVFNQRDPEAAGELYADDFIGVGPNVEKAGRAGAIAGLRRFVDAFTDMTMTFDTSSPRATAWSFTSSQPVGTPASSKEELPREPRSLFMA